MSGTIIDYLNKYGDCSFLEMPMNEVDSLALCQLSYLKFDGMVPDVRKNGPSITLEKLAEHADFGKLFADERFEKNNRALFAGMMSGKRFRGMRLNCYINLVEKEWETQFSAITFLLEDGTIYIAFRGTDETIVGWKEDFNMAFLSPVPGQEYSVKYLNMVTGRLHRSFYVGGHSKGGNLAIYSAMNCVPSVRKRILKIYSMDGPGFRPEVLEKSPYEEIADRVVKILPHSSLIGMIFESDVRYQVVESGTRGLMQHDPFTWLVEDAAFVKVEDIYENRRKMDNTLNEWILSLNEQQLRTFVETLFQVVSAAQAEDLITFTADWRKSMNAVISALREVDEQTVRILREMLKSLFEIAANHAKQEIMQEVPEKLFLGGKRKNRKSRKTKEIKEQTLPEQDNLSPKPNPRSVQSVPDATELPK